MALLMQGCRREEAPAAPVEDTNTIVAPTMTDTNIMAPVDTNTPVATSTNLSTEVPPAVVDTNVLNTANNVAGNTEYTVAKGDSFYTIAKKFSTTSKAIAAANPTVNPSKLQIGQKLVIPSGATAVVADVAKPTNIGTAAVSSGGGSVYTVKSGDNLTKIATQHGVSVKALRAANNLTTDRITVGQKLKIPAK